MYRVALILAFVVSLVTSITAQTTTMSVQPRQLQNIGYHIGADPAAGAEWTVTVPAGSIWRILSVQAQLVTNATVANRQAQFIVDNGNGTEIIFISETPSNQAASLTRRYVAGAGLSRLDEGVAATVKQWSLPVGLTLTGGQRIRTFTAAIVAGDDWTAPIVTFESYR